MKLLQNKFTFKDKALIFPLITGFILVIIVFALVFITLTNSGKGNGNTPNSQTPPSYTLVVNKVVPDEPEILTAGNLHTFYIYFNAPVSLQQLSFTLTAVDVTQDSPEPVAIPYTTDLTSAQTVALVTKNVIKERMEYTLSVIDASGEILSQTTYLSGDLPPTIIPVNDQTLKQYLPYNTNSYTLEYIAKQNLYVFHFKYDPTNNENLQQQIDDAKSQATQFIESKGVNINSIVIDFRSS